MSSSKTVTRTIRIDDETDRLLAELAGEEKVSVNLLVNKALRRYVEWEAQAEKFGFVTVPTTVHAKFYTYLTDDEAREFGRWVGENFARDFIIFWFKKITLDTVLGALKLLSSEYARVFEFEDSFDGKNHTIILKHGRGPKGSLLNEQFLRTVFNGLLGKQVQIERTEDQVVARFSAEPVSSRPHGATMR